METALPVSSSLIILLSLYEGTPSILVKIGEGMLPMSFLTADNVLSKCSGCWGVRVGCEAAVGVGGVLSYLEIIIAKLREYDIEVKNVLNKFYELNALRFERCLKLVSALCAQ